MKKYILIQNDGEIETNSFELIGASTKRGEHGKIGFFGSGLKYSIAYMMRQGIEFRVFSGENELKFTTHPEQLKGHTFDRICINDTPTSYTVTMGPTWTEDWFVLREIYCNAIDESNCQLIKETDAVNSVEGKTRIYIELTQKLQSIIDNWDRYFSDEREPFFTNEDTYTSFIGTEDIEGRNKQKVIVFNKTEGVIYRKGVRCYVRKGLLFDYHFEFLNINEDRTAKSIAGMSYCIAYLIGRLINETYVKSILRTAIDDEPCKEYYDIETSRPDNGFSEKWVKFSKDNVLVVKEVSGKFAQELQKTKKEVFLIPAFFARDLKKQFPETVIIGMGRAIGDVGMSDIDKTPKMDFLLKEVLLSLKQMNYEVPYDITVVQFNDENTLGQADLKEKQIFLSDRVFDMGRREIAMTLIEETEHIYSQQEDETRGFQNHLISSWLKSMENANALFL
jgi:hypothetical protein